MLDQLFCGVNFGNGVKNQLTLKRQLLTQSRNARNGKQLVTNFGGIRLVYVTYPLLFRSVVAPLRELSFPGLTDGG